MVRSLALTADLPTFVVVMALALALLSLALIVAELVRHRGTGLIIASTGLLATALLLAAIVRPAWITARASSIGPRVVVLVDRSMSMTLPGDSATRWTDAIQALREMASHAREARISYLGFGEGPAQPFDPAQHSSQGPVETRTDLTTALTALAAGAEERPAAIVVLSDGRLDLPGADHAAEAVSQALGPLRVPVHTVAAAEHVPRDASVRSVRSAGAAVAHQPMNLTVEVGCDGGLSCTDLDIVVRELVENGNPLVLARGAAHLQDGKATVDLPITLDRAGARVVEVAVASPPGDEIPDNDHRLLTFQVTRDRVRILHIAGRPTYDVRALRQWLKSDASLDVVAFFILRTPLDDVNASPDDLALIRFPVDELFTEHLPSFDAVVLQDFPADPYGLAPYFQNLATYVEKGGGLIMVGGINAFSSGGYAGTPLERVLPVALVRESAAAAMIDATPFMPQYTTAGRGTPVLEALRSLLGDELPTMSGTNLLGDTHPGSVVLWEHPTRKAPGGAPMPVLALGEKGNGRTLAMSIDDSHKLAFSEVASRTAGRGYGLLWDALLGWLMRDPRYEPARIDLESQCIADRGVKLRVRPVPGTSGPAELTIAKLGNNEAARPVALPATEGKPFEVTLPPLDQGGYAARIRVGSGPSTRHDFACERGADEWADTRPDPGRLAAIAKATGGRSVSWKHAGSLPFPSATQIATEHHVAAVLPPWAWTVAAALALGMHWIARRKFGLA